MLRHRQTAWCAVCDGCLCSGITHEAGTNSVLLLFREILNGTIVFLYWLQSHWGILFLRNVSAREQGKKQKPLTNGLCLSIGLTCACATWCRHRRLLHEPGTSALTLQAYAKAFFSSHIGHRKNFGKEHVHHLEKSANLSHCSEAAKGNPKGYMYV